MPKTVHVNLPVRSRDMDQLDVGDKVLLTGKLYTARDAAHQRLIERIRLGKPLPFDIKGAALYYVGPAPARPDRPIGSAGPTTSYRMDPYSPALLDAGLRVMIGKGPRSQPVINAMIKNHAVYLAAIGGAAVVMAQSVKSARIIAYEELGPEAIYELEVEKFPAFVANDVHGNDIFQSGTAMYRQD